MSRPLRVLFVEDSEDDTLLLVRELRRGGYDPTYERVDTAAAMCAVLTPERWDIVIADYNMPDFSGLAALKLLQEHELDLPFLLVSGSIGEDRAVAALKAGVHDYLMKDKLLRLVSAVERELRESELRSLHRRAEQQLRQAEAKYRTLVEQIPAIIYSAALDATSGTLYISPQIEAILGVSQAEWLADPQRWLKHLHPRDIDRVLADMAHSQAGGEPVRSEFRMLARDGRVVWFRDEAMVVRDEAGQPLFLQGVWLDISERKEAEEALQQANAELAARVAELRQRTHELTRLGEMNNLLHACLTAEEAYMVIATAMPQLFPNQAGALAMINPARNQVETVAEWSTPSSVCTFDRDQCWALWRGQVHVVNDPRTDLICAHVHAPIPASYVCVPLMARGDALGVLHVSQSVCEGSTETRQRLAQMVAGQLELVLANVQLRETLQSQAIRDPLTGLFNRRYLEESLERELCRARRSGQSLGVLMLDIDHFKRFNDTYGHEAGNTLLCAASSFLQTQIRKEDIACRYGGEEFTIILPGTARETALQRAEEVRAGIKQLQVQHFDQPLGAITASIGVAISPDHGTTVASLLERADAALYIAKRAGRDRVELA